MRLFAIGLLAALPMACASTSGTLAIVQAVATPTPVSQISIKTVCDGLFIWRLLHPDTTEPHWEAVVDAACAKDPQSFAGAGVDLLEAAVMLKLDVSGAPA